MGVLIDTCIWIDVEQGRLAPEDVSALTADRPVYLSPVTLAELRLGAELASDPGVRQKRMRTWRTMVRKPVVPIDAGTAEVFGELAAHPAYRIRRHHRKLSTQALSAARRAPARSGPTDLFVECNGMEGEC